MSPRSSPGSRASAVAALGVGSYLAAFGWSWPYDLPLLVLGACGAVAVLLDQSRRPPRPGALVVCVGCFVLSGLVSLAGADDVPRGIRLSVSVVPGLLVFLLLARYVTTSRDVARVQRGLCVAALALAIRILLATFARPELEPAAVVRAIDSPLLVVPNDVLMLAVVAPLAVALLCCAGHWTGRIVAATSLLVSVAAILALQSRVAVVTIVVTLLCFGGYVRRAGLASAAAVAAVVVGGEAARGWPLLRKSFLLANPRLALWTTALAMFRDAPLLGHGPHTFGVLRPGYLQELTFPAWFHADDRVVPWAHNLYLESLAERGVLGFAALAALLGCALVQCGRRVRAQGASPERVLAAGVVAALCGFCWAAAFELTFLRQWVVVTMFALLGLAGHWSALGHEMVAGTHSSRAPKMPNASDST